MKQYIDSLKSAATAVISGKIDITKKDFDISDYKDKKAEYYKKTIEQSIRNLRSFDFGGYPRENAENIAKIKLLIDKLDDSYKNKQIESILSVVEQISKINLVAPKIDKLKVQIPKVPSEIREIVVADARELEKAFNADCYRSSIILCGRIIETCLHRKYYDLTGKDILETSPGVGLGNLIAKLKENGFVFDPGLSEQIHLINQVRIWSVHTKKEVFYPTKEQAHAIVLYTLDVVKKLFL